MACLARSAYRYSRKRSIADIQKSAAGQYRQGFVRRAGAQVGPKSQWVQVLRQQPQVGAVGVIHQKRDMVCMGHLTDGPQIGQNPEIIRAGQVHGPNLGVCG